MGLRFVMIFQRRDSPSVPSTNNYRAQRREQAPALQEFLTFSVGDGALDVPKANGHRKTNNQPVILSGEKRLRFA